jgi:hypothetical protein
MARLPSIPRRRERSDEQVLSGAALTSLFGDPTAIPVVWVREPDVIVTPDVGVIYTHSNAKNAEHGGFSHDDTNVVLLVSAPGLERVFGSTAHDGVITTPVQTTQIAPTILDLLGIDPTALQAVQQEYTTVLSGLGQPKPREQR